MDIATLVRVLEQPHHAAEALQDWGLTDPGRGRQRLVDLAEAGLTLDLLADLCGQLAAELPRLPDADAALAALVRYVHAVRSPLGLAALLERDRSALPMLLASLQIAPQWTELLVADPEAFDLLRENGGLPLDRARLAGDVAAEALAFSDERGIVAALARLQSRHLFRIAYAEAVGRQRLELVLEQLTFLAEALLAAAMLAAERRVLETRRLSDRQRAESRVCVLALGRLGAEELAYKGNIDLLFVYSTPDAASRAVQEHFERVSKLLARYFNEAQPGELAWNARFVPLPESPVATTAHAAEDVVIGFASFGRTWHRQALLKARCVAGDFSLGASVLNRLEPFVYRRYLARADETGIKALKRRILMEATLHQDDWQDERLARGGLRDLEATVGFLQLLAGGDQAGVRCRGTLPAIAGLEQAEAISPEERHVLEDSFRTLRIAEHRRQVVGELADRSGPNGTASFEWQARLDRYWQTYCGLLQAAFALDGMTAREVDLLLDPDPPAAEVRASLAPFGFARPEQALANLHHLAEEQVAFLSTRRCRHLLAGILPALLREIARTLNPDQTLDNLARVSAALGGKGVLWDLFRASPPTLQLYVRLCAASPYLSDVLTTNPGMLDELVDSLQLDKLPARDELAATLDELCRGVGDTLSVLHDFKNAQHLRIGVRDLLGKDDIDRCHTALADVAEVCLNHVVAAEYERLSEKFGVPRLGPGPLEGETCGFTIVGLGKLGARQPNYHSPLELLLLYAGEGTTRSASRSTKTQSTANNHFFTQLAQGIAKQLAQLTPKGRLYAVETPLWPLGIGGALALAESDFQQHFAGGAAPLWQWQMLCQARPVGGSAAARESVKRLLKGLLLKRPWQASDAAEISRLRRQLEASARPANFKRGAGGTLDVEFLVERLQLEHAARHPEILATNTQAALVALAGAGVLPVEIAGELGQQHRFLRRVEAGLRLLNAPARHDLPDDAEQLAQLALLLGHSNPQRLREQSLDAMRANREIFGRWMPGAEAAAAGSET